MIMPMDLVKSRSAIVILAMFMVAQALGAADSPPRVALVVSGDGKAGVVETLLEARLLERDDIEMVERQDLDRAMVELNLSAAGMLREDDFLKLGRLLLADHIVVVSRDPQRETPSLTLRILEYRTGVRSHMSEHLLDDRDAKDIVVALLAAVDDAIKGEESAQVITIAVSTFQNASAFDRLTPLEFGIREQVCLKFAQYIGIRVSEREEVNALIDEDSLAGVADGENGGQTATEATRKAQYFLSGSFQENTELPELQMDLKVRLIDQDKGTLIWQTNVTYRATNWMGACGFIVTNVVAETAAKTSVNTSRNEAVRDEASHLFQSAVDLIARTDVVSSGDALWSGLPGVRLPTCTLRGQGNAGQRVRKAVNSLECYLILNPTHLPSRILLGRCFENASSTQKRRALRLYEYVFDADTDGALGGYAAGRIGIMASREWMQAKTSEEKELWLQAAYRVHKRPGSIPPDWVCKAMGLDYSKELWERSILALEAYTSARLLPYENRDAFAGLLKDLEGRARGDSEKDARFLAVLEELLQSESGHIRYYALSTLAGRAEAGGDAAKARELYLRALELCDNTKDGWLAARKMSLVMATADTWLKADDKDAALAFLESHFYRYERSPWYNASYLYKLSELYEERGEYRKSLRLFEIFHAAYPHESRLYGRTGKIESLRKKLGITEEKQRQDVVVDTFRCPGGKGISMVCVDGERILCVADDSGGLFEFSPDERTWQQLGPFGSGRGPGVSAITVQAGRLIVGTGAGLWVQRGPGSEEWVNYSTTNGLPCKRVTALAVDDDELFVGLGDDEKGIVVSSTKAGHFRHVKDTPWGPVTGLVVDKTNLWITAWSYRGSGLVVIDRKTDEQLSLGPYVRVFPAPGGVFATGAGANTRFYHFTDGGKTGKSVPCRMPPRENKASYGPLYFDAAVDTGDRIWFTGTVVDVLISSALYSMDKSTGLVSLYNEASGVHCMKAPDIAAIGDTVWVASDQGLMRLVAKGPEAEQPERSQAAKK